MNTKLFISSIFLSTSLSLFAQKSATITLHTDQSELTVEEKLKALYQLQTMFSIISGLTNVENFILPSDRIRKKTLQKREKSFHYPLVTILFISIFPA